MRLAGASLGIAVLVLGSSCVSESGSANPFAGYRMVDLSHAFDESTVFWPTGQRFQHERTAWGRQAAGYWYSAYDFAMSEHTGTHLDAPVHFAESGRTVGSIALDDLAGSLAVIDIRPQCAADRDYAARPADLEAHESKHGPIGAGMIVVFRTGWSRRWPDTLAYLGDDTPGSAESLRFPGISAEVATDLAERGVSTVGIDTASIDPGDSQDFAAHQVLAGASIPVLENVANLSEVPARGAYVLAFPMKIGKGSGAPCRVAAMVPTD